MAKTCRRCFVAFPIEAFVWNDAAHRYRGSWCRACRAAYHREPAVRARQRMSVRAHYQRHPEQARAHARLRYAVRRGRLTRPHVCQQCDGPGPIDAHHARGYLGAQALDVDWLCHACHARQHRNPATPPD